MALSYGYQSAFGSPPGYPRTGLIVHRHRNCCKVRENQKALSHHGHTINPRFSHRHHTIFALIRELVGRNAKRKTAKALKSNAKAVNPCGSHVNRITILSHSQVVWRLCVCHQSRKGGQTTPNHYCRNCQYCLFSFYWQATWPNP